MKIHVVQREGTRYFSRFSDISERDRLVVELQIEEKNGNTISIDLTEALIAEYSKHPQIGKVRAPGVFAEIVSIQPIKPLVTRRAKTVSPIERADSQTSDILSRVREAQLKAAEERKRKQAEQNAARAERLAVAREAKAKKQKAESRAQRAEKQRAESKTPKARSAPVSKTSKPAAESKQLKLMVKPAATKTAKPAKPESAKLSATQESAIKKIGNVVAKEDKLKPRSQAPEPAATKPRAKPDRPMRS